MTRNTLTTTDTQTTRNNTKPGTQTNTDTESETDTSSNVNAGDNCPFNGCNGTINEDSKTHETYCSDCGIVLDNTPIDHGPEWRAYNDEEKESRSRVGAPTTETLHDKGLSTKVGRGNTDANGNKLSNKKQRQVNRLRKWQNRSLTKNNKQRGVKKGLVEIKRMKSALGVPDNVAETASMIFKQASENDLLPGRSIEGVAAACLYTAAKIEEVSQSYEEVTAVSRVNQRRIERAYMHLVKKLDVLVPPSQPEEYIPRFVDRTTLSNNAKREAKAIVKQHRESNTKHGAAPTSLAGASIYAASIVLGEKISQSNLSDAVNVSEPTIREFYKEMLEVYSDFDYDTEKLYARNAAKIRKEFNDGEAP